MNIFDRIWLELRFFFIIDAPLSFSGMSTSTKVILLILLILLSPAIMALLYVGGVLIFLSIMSLITSNKTYEPLYPAEEIAVIEIVEITEDVGLYFHNIDAITPLLDEHTTVIAHLTDAQIDACMADLLGLSAYEWWNDPNPYLQDGTLRITYQNGSREWICATGTFYYDSYEDDASMTWYYFNRDEFLSYLQKYGYQKSR